MLKTELDKQGKMQKSLYFGAVYCPYAKSGDVEMEYWERDILTMKELNFNIIRPFVAWDRIEKTEGVCDYSKLDHIFALAKKHDINILLNLAGVLDCCCGLYPPRWLIYDYNIQPIIEDPRKMELPFGPSRHLCSDDPVYWRKATDFIVQTIHRYAASEKLLAWNLWNEAFYTQDGCFCPLTLAKFRQWLRGKYNSLENLNSAWGGEFPVFYRSWDDIEPGGEAGFRAGYVARMDWLAFNRAQIADRLDEIDRLVRANDPHQRPTTTNVATVAAFSGSRHNYPSMFDQNRGRDIPGYSAYTFHGAVNNAPWLNAEALSIVRSSGQDLSRGFWAIETEAGQESRFSEKHLRSEQGWRIASNWQMVLHGARMIMLWKFGGRNTDTQTDSFNLTGWDGSITERALLQAEFAETFLANKSLFMARNYTAETAILISTSSEIASIADKTHKAFADARHGAYRIMHDLRIPCDFIDDRLMRDGRLSRYKALIIPAAAFLDSAAAETIADYVRRGGCVIADRRFAMKDQNTRHFQTTPGFELQETFGAWMNDADYAEYGEKVLSEDSDAVFDISDRFHSHLHLEEAVAVAEYSAGGCAVSHKTAGPGTAWLWGFEPFLEYGETTLISGDGIFRTTPWNHNSLILNLMQQALREAGVESDYLIEGDENFSIEAGALSGKDGSRVHFLINFADIPIKFKLEIRSGGCFKDLLSDRHYCDMPTEFEIPAYGTLILCPES
jgi:beta-galactosidase GanA